MPASYINSKFKIQGSKLNGFTLIELLVAISILAVVGTLLFVDFSPFRTEQSVQIAAAEVQNFVRLAQVNATSGVICNGIAGASWSVVFSKESNRVLMECNNTDQRVLNLKQDVVIEDVITGINETVIIENPNSCSGDLSIEFSPILGKVSFIPASAVDANCSGDNLQYGGMILKGNGDRKAVIISKGGVIYVQELENE